MSTMRTNWQGAAKLVDPRIPMRRGAIYVAEMRIRNMLKWWQALIAFGLGNPILYLLSVGIGIGSMVNKHASFMEGQSYLTFLAPALLVTAGIQGAMDEVTFPTIEGFVWEKTFFAMNATAITGRQIVNGVMFASLARCVLQVLLYELVLVAFGAVSLASFLPLLITSVLAGGAFASLMLGVTSYVKEDDGFFAIVGRFIITPMFMFSGTYYPLSSLPGYLQWIGWVSPVWHATDFGRALSYNHPVQGWLMIVHALYFVVIAGIGLSFARRKFALRLAA
jgi:lipooligosaccharide transport system permease protein